MLGVASEPDTDRRRQLVDAKPDKRNGDAKRNLMNLQSIILIDKRIEESNTCGEHHSPK